MWHKTCKTLFGAALIPFCLGFTWQFVTTVVSLAYRPEMPYYFLLGGFAYLTVHLLFNKPVLTYVFGHELTHALFAVLFGGAVKSFHAGERGGRVVLTKSNFIITLAPYFFPLYTFMALVLYWLAGIFDARGTEGWLVFLAGATCSFHLLLTIVFLRTDQDDIREHGALFSYPLIYLFNVAFVALLIQILLARNTDYLGFLTGGIIKSVSIIALLFKKLYGVIHGQ